MRALADAVVVGASTVRQDDPQLTVRRCLGRNPMRVVIDCERRLGALADLARRLLEANKEPFGHVTTGSMRRGEENWVYGRRGKPCRRCGTPIRSAGQDDRVTFWCPSCQPG